MKINTQVKEMTKNLIPYHITKIIRILNVLCQLGLVVNFSELKLKLTKETEHF